MLIGQLALVVAALFTGACLYVSLVEHPARIEAGEEAGLAQWKPSAARARLMQAALSMLGTVLAFIVWWRSLNQLWLIGALLLLANLPFTLLVILKVNRALEAAAPGADVRALLMRWGRLHAVRTLLGLAAVLTLLAASYWRL